MCLSSFPNLDLQEKGANFNSDTKSGQGPAEPFFFFFLTLLLFHFSLCFLFFWSHPLSGSLAFFLTLVGRKVTFRNAPHSRSHLPFTWSLSCYLLTLIHATQDQSPKFSNLGTISPPLKVSKPWSWCVYSQKSLLLQMTLWTFGTMTCYSTKGIWMKWQPPA